MSDSKHKMERLAIIIREDAYDRVYTPLTFAYVAAKQGVKVDILFVLWAVRLMTKEGAAAAKMHPLHQEDEKWFKAQLEKNAVPLDLHQFMVAVKNAGDVNFYGCKIAARNFDVALDDLLPEAEGIVDSQWFLEQKVMPADHCQYF